MVEQSAEWYKAHVLCEPVASVRKRYSSPPLPGVEPDPDYEPEVGEWFWWYMQDSRMWELRKGLKSGDTLDKNLESTGFMFKSYTKRCLPATAPV